MGRPVVERPLERRGRDDGIPVAVAMMRGGPDRGARVTGSGNRALSSTGTAGHL